MSESSTALMSICRDKCFKFCWIGKNGREEEDLYLIICCELLNFEYSWIHVLDVVQVREHECFLHVKSARNYILRILISQPRWDDDYSVG